MKVLLFILAEAFYLLLSIVVALGLGGLILFVIACVAMYVNMFTAVIVTFLIMLAVCVTALRLSKD
ncbi:hypothetical protein D3C76_1842990 [compost metagenome]